MIKYAKQKEKSVIMKRIISLILSIVILSTLVLSVSCAQEEEVFDMDFHVDYVVDLTGVTFQWGTGWLTQFYPNEGFSLVGDNMRQHYRDIEAELGCNIDIVAWEDGGRRVMQDVAAGMKTCDLVDSHATNAGIELYKAGLLAALDDIPNFNGYDEKYGPMRFRQYGIFDGKLYGLYQYLWYFPPEFHGIMSFNVDLLSSLGVALPYEYQENGTWTWANYKDYLMTIDNAASSAGYGNEFIPHTAQVLTRDVFSWMFMNGCKVIEKDSNGNYVCGVNNTKGMATLDFLGELSDLKLYEEGGTDPFIKNQTAAIMTSESYFTTHFQEGNESAYLPGQPWIYGVVNYPYGPDGDENCVSGFVHKGRRLNWVVAYSGSELSDIGIFLDHLFEPIDEEGGWKSSLSYSVFHDKRDFENYLKILENVNYNHDLSLGAAYSNLESSCVFAAQGKRTGAEAFESVKTMIDEAMKNVTWVYEDLID